MKLKRLIPTLFIACVVLTVPTGNVFAFGNSFPDKLDQRTGTFDPNNSTVDATVFAYAGQTQFVQQAKVSYLKAWFPGTSGTVTILKPNYCSINPEDTLQNGDAITAYSNLTNGTNITEFTVGTQTQYGKKLASTDTTNCNASMTFNVTGLTTIENGYYRADITITHVDKYAGTCSGTSIGGCDGIMNGYRVTSSGGYIGLLPSTTGYTTTQVQYGDDPLYMDYIVPFGTACTQTTGANGTRVYLYDLDNAGGGGAQPANYDITVGIYDDTDGAFNLLTAKSAGTFNATLTKWTPASVDNASQWVEFTSEVEHKYRLIIYNVYENNAIQYSVPYSQINYLPCKKATVTATAGASLSSTGPFTAGISATPGSTVHFNNQATVTGASLSGSNVFQASIYSLTSGLDFAASNYALTDGAKIPAGNATLPFTIPASATPGTQYCRRTVIGAKPTYTPAFVNVVGNNAEACVTVVSGAAVNPTTLGSTYEKGSATAPTIVHKVQINSMPTCNTTNTTITELAPNTLTWSAQATATNGVGTTQSGTVRFTNNCKVRVYLGTTLQSESGFNPTEVVLTTYTGDTVALSAYAVAPGAAYSRTTTVGATTSSAGSIEVYEVPYVRFYGNDILAAGDYTSDPNTGVIKTNRATSLAGAGSEYAAVARGIINSISTAFINGNSPYTRLLSAGSDVQLPNLPDSANASANGLGSITLSAPIASLFSGPLTINASAVNNSAITIDATGQDVYIAGNITGNTTPTAFGQGAAVLIKAKDIYIDNNVTQIDAVLFAEGNIYTCATAQGTRVALQDRDNLCRTKLTVNGALRAARIEFARTLGSRNGNSSAPTSVTEPATQPNGVINTAAEVVNFPDYLYFRNFNVPTTSTQGFDSYFNLPPRL